MRNRAPVWSTKESQYVKPKLKIRQKIVMGGVKYKVIQIMDRFVLCETTDGFKESFQYFDVRQSLQNKGKLKMKPIVET